MDQAFDLTPQRREYTVGELTAEMAALLADAYTGIWVRGEVSGCKLAASGHAYFTLKDDNATIRAACWKGAYRLLKIKPKDGLEVLARGRIEIYEPRGEYQFIVESLEPVGEGALQAAFEKLKNRLAAEGLFDQDRKRPLPRLPRRIGVITSPTGAVIRDILHVLERRFPGLHVRLFPAQVQGPGSAAQVAAGLDYFSKHPWADVVILARGGGSLEDLWTFNEEEVARAIARSNVPIISAIGHETDFTIADFAADRRAPTPSAAAEIVTESREAIYTQIRAAHSRIAQSMRLGLSRAARRLDSLGTGRAQMTIERRLFRAGQRLDFASQALQTAWSRQASGAGDRLEQIDRRLRRLDLRIRLQSARLRLEQATSRAESAIERRLAVLRSQLDRPSARLSALDPLQILERGFAVVTSDNGAVLRHPAGAPPGTLLRIRLAGGAIDAVAGPAHQDGK
ncbi:MAG TPA: exodeoxyribonuclease VII large subunit [Bryobacteraceae bacterium]|nr:exodeoxyribonuclease VII large subunit [Bryobacteraceae bacterium]